MLRISKRNGVILDQDSDISFRNGLIAHSPHRGRGRGPSRQRWEGEGVSERNALTRLRAPRSGTLSRNAGEGLFAVMCYPLIGLLYSASLTCSPQAVPSPFSPASDKARCAKRRSGEAPCQCIVLGGMLTMSPG